jgi:hypothetical protein
VLRKKSRLFCTFRNWLIATFAVPYTTRRALSLVATAASVSGPLGSWGSGFTCPASSEARSVSPHESGVVRGQRLDADALAAGVFGVLMLAASGNSVVKPSCRA